jgi:hypothetical protein
MGRTIVRVVVMRDVMVRDTETATEIISVLAYFQLLMALP